MIKQNEKQSMTDEIVPHVEIPKAVEPVPESLIQILWRNRLIVLVSMLAVMAGILIYLIKATPIYTSTSKIYVEQSGPKIINEMEEGVMTRSQNYLYNQIELLKSTPILTAMLDKTDIRQMKTFTDVRNHINYLKKKLDVTVGKKNDIISISFDSPWSYEAAQIVNAVVNSYVTYHSTRKRSTSGEVLKILEIEKAKRNKELSEKLEAMMNYKKDNMALAFESRQGNIILQRLERLSSVLTEAQLESIDTKSAFESMKEMVSEPTRLKQYVEAQLTETRYNSTSSERAKLVSKLEELEIRRSDRLRQVTPGHPAVEALDSEIGQIKNQITEMDNAFAQARLAVVEQQYQTARQKEEQISKNFEEQRQLALDLNEQNAQYTILESEWEQTKKLCDILDDRIKELNITEDVGALNISILEAAEASVKPSKPEKYKYIAIAVFVGIMLGCGLALLYDLVDQRMRSAEEVKALLSMPVLGVVPSMHKEQSIVARGQKIHIDPNSRVSEVYRTIRTAIFFGVPNGKAKTILVTSPGAAEGKTTLVSNLAIAMAQAGQKTLILDADFRNPTQYRIFEMNGNKGLVSLLSKNSTLEETIRPTGIKSLELLPCRTQLVNSSEILNSKSFTKLLKNLSNKYDRIVIDSPPVVPVTDAQILAALCDITLLVLRAEQSTRKMSQQARDGLLSVGAHLLGVVVNDEVLGKGGLYGRYGKEKTWQLNNVK